MEENNDELKTIHTYQTDAEEAIRRNNISRTQVFVAEQEKNQKEISPKSLRTSGFSFNFRSIIFVLLFLILGSVGIYFFVRTSEQESIIPQPIPSTPEAAIISYDSLSSADLSVLNRENLISLINEKKQAHSTGLEIISFNIVTEDFLNFLAPNLSGTLKRSFHSQFAFGLFGETASESPRSFLVLKVNSYSNARGSLFSEENVLTQELDDVFNIPSSLNLQFKDRVLDNHDARVLTDPENNFYFLYSFIDADTLVFAEDDDTFRIIIDQINSAKR